MNQNVMDEQLKALSISYGAETTMHEHAGMSQPLGITSSFTTNMPLPQQTSGDCKASDLFVKVWEGALCGTTQGQSCLITKLEGYRRATGSETNLDIDGVNLGVHKGCLEPGSLNIRGAHILSMLAADWPPMMQMDEFISKEHMRNMESYSQAEFVAFQPLGQHEFLCEIHDKKLCAVIQLPSQILLLSVSGKAGCLTGLIMPNEPNILFRDACILEPGKKKRKKEPDTMFSTSQETSLGGDNVQGVKPMVTTSLQTSPLPIGQSGDGMNQNIMDEFKSFITSYGAGTMMPTGMSQQGQAGMQPLGVTNNSTTNMPLPQQTSGGCKASALFVKVWEGALCGTRQGQSGFITKLGGYRRASGSESLAADWPPMMQILRFISKEHSLNRAKASKAEFVAFRPLIPLKHENLSQIQDENLYTVILLPSQILLLNFWAKTGWFKGMLVPMVFSQFTADRLSVTLGCKKKYNVDDHQRDSVMSNL